MTEPARDEKLSPDLERKFKEQFGREMTSEERRLLYWAERAAPSRPKPGKTD